MKLPSLYGRADGDVKKSDTWRRCSASRHPRAFHCEWLSKRVAGVSHTVDDDALSPGRVEYVVGETVV